MPMPAYFKPAREKIDLVKLTNGMSPSEIVSEIDHGARFVIYQYVASGLVVTFRHNSKTFFIRPGKSAALKSWPYTLLTLLMGWWGIPWGLIYTPQVLYKNLKGGADITPMVLAHVRNQANTAGVSTST